MKQYPFILPAGKTGHAAAALAETILATAVTSVLAAGLLITAVVVQSNFRACQNHATAQADQLRLLDSISLDLRRCLTVTTGQNTIALTIPDFYDGNGEPRTPVISNGGIDYGNPNAPIAVTYYKQGNTIFRSENGTATAMAESVDDFEIGFEDQSDVIKTSISFLPEFQQWGGHNSVRASTETYASTLLRNTRQN